MRVLSETIQASGKSVLRPRPQSGTLWIPVRINIFWPSLFDCESRERHLRSWTLVSSVVNSNFTSNSVFSMSALLTDPISRNDLCLRLLENTMPDLHGLEKTAEVLFSVSSNSSHLQESGARKCSLEEGPPVVFRSFLSGFP